MAKKNKSGRKKVDPREKVILVGFYTKKSVVDNCGGMSTVRDIAKKYVEDIATIK